MDHTPSQEGLVDSEPGVLHPEPWVIDTQERTLDRISEWIRAVDAKASPLLAISTALMAAIVALAGRPGVWSQWTIAWLAIGTGPELFSVLAVALATSPQLAPRVSSLIFFGDIAKSSPATYALRTRQRTRNEYLEDLIEQCHRNSEIAENKFRWIRVATLTLILAIVPWLVALFFVVVG